MTSRLLGELAAEDSSLLPLHAQNLEFVLNRWYRETPEGIGYIFFDGKSKLGANAMALRALVWSPFYEKYAVQADRIARGIVSLINDNGSFEPWLFYEGVRPDKAYILTFYSGEAILALLEYSAKSKRRGILESARRTQEFYIDQYVRRMDINYYPAYVPWHTLSLNLLYKETGDRRYANAAFALNDKVLELLDTTRVVGRFFNPATPQYGTPHASSDGVYTEGMAYAYELAVLCQDETRRSRYRRALQFAVDNLISLQISSHDVRRLGEDSLRALGAIRTNGDVLSTRMDNTQHVMDAYRKILQVW